MEVSKTNRFWAFRYAALAVVLVITLSGCGPASTVIFGAELNNLLGQVQQIIARATDSLNVSLLTAGNVVQTTIYNIASSYGQDLNKAITTNENNVLDQVRGDIDKLNKGAEQDIKDVVDGSQQLINSLPIANRQPQVRSYTPQLTVVNPGQVAELTVTGNFFYADQNKLTPTLKIGDQTLNPDEIVTTDLRFTIPQGVLPVSNGSLQTAEFELDVPYPSGKLIKDKIQAGVFRLPVTIMPKSPFRSFVVTNLERGTATQNAEFPTNASSTNNRFRADSSDTCKEDKETMPVPVDPGWTIVDHSIQVKELQIRNPNKVTYQVPDGPVGVQGFNVSATTEPGQVCVAKVVSSGSGMISFYVTFVEEQPTTPSPGKPVPYEFVWGQTNDDLPVSAGWKVDAVTFDGVTNTLKATDTAGSPYFTLVDYVDHIRISTLNLKDIHQL